MENNDNGDWTYILERKENWLVGFLSVCWTIINCGMSIIISFFVNQQEVIPLTRGGLIGLFPYIYMVTRHMYTYMYFKTITTDLF